MRPEFAHLNDEEFARLVHNTMDELTATNVERELLARLEKRIDADNERVSRFSQLVGQVDSLSEAIRAAQDIDTE